MTEYIYGSIKCKLIPEFKLERREEIVRCRDCANYATDKFGDYCTLLDFEDVKGMANGFCAWASRREGAES